MNEYISRKTSKFKLVMNEDPAAVSSYSVAASLLVTKELGPKQRCPISTDQVTDEAWYQGQHVEYRQVHLNNLDRFVIFLLYYTNILGIDISGSTVDSFTLSWSPKLQWTGRSLQVKATCL